VAPVFDVAGWAGRGDKAERENQPGYHHVNILEQNSNILESGGASHVVPHLPAACDIDDPSGSKVLCGVKYYHEHELNLYNSIVQKYLMSHNKRKQPSPFGYLFADRVVQRVYGRHGRATDLIIMRRYRGKSHHLTVERFSLKRNPDKLMFARGRDWQLFSYQRRGPNSPQRPDVVFMVTEGVAVLDLADLRRLEKGIKEAIEWLA